MKKKAFTIDKEKPAHMRGIGLVLKKRGNKIFFKNVAGPINAERGNTHVEGKENDHRNDVSYPFFVYRVKLHRSTLPF